MVDKVLAIVRETMLHENALESIAFRPHAGEVALALLQPDGPSSHFAHELVLTFSGVTSFSAEGGWWGLAPSGGADVLSIACEPAEGGYTARIALGDSGAARWEMHLAFGDLRYRRSGSPRIH